MDSWVAWTILFVLVMGGFYRLIVKASEEWQTKDYDEYHFNGYENPYWRNK